MRKMKTRYFTMIHLELERAEKKHPDFVSAIIDPSSRVSWAESESRIKARNAMAKEYADNVLMEEIAEAFAAYQKGDKAQALQELAKRILPTLPEGWYRERHEWDAAKW